MQVTIADYDPSWPDHFDTEAERIATALGNRFQRIEHIGSTAVPRLAAKPIIDILVTLDDLEDESLYRTQLEDAGYALRVHEPGHRMFRSIACDVHVHLWRSQSEDERHHLLLRDWLRINVSDRGLYEQSKRRLAKLSWRERNDYAQAKTPVIAEILARAERALLHKIHVRPYRPGDAASLAEIFFTSVRELGRRKYTPAQRRAWAPCIPDSNAWEARMLLTETFVAERDGNAVAFVEFEQNGHLNMLYRSPCIFSNGAVSALYEVMERRARKLGIASITTEASLLAESFFLKRGYSIDGREHVERNGTLLARAPMSKTLT